MLTHALQIGTRNVPRALPVAVKHGYGYGTAGVITGSPYVDCVLNSFTARYRSRIHYGPINTDTVREGLLRVQPQYGGSQYGYGMCGHPNL